MFQIKKNRTKKAVTLVEVILTISLVSIVAIGSVPFVLNSVKTEEDNLTLSKVVYQLKLARSYALSSYLNDNWGVAITDSELTLFKGSSYANRDSNYDITEDVKQNSIQTSASEVVFQKFSGNTDIDLDVNILSDSENNLIKVYKNGLIEF